MEEVNISRLDELEEIIVAPYCHADFAWTNSRAWHKCRYIKSFSDALDIMRENPDFTYGIDNAIHNLIVFMGNCPDRIEELRERVKDGRMYVMNGGVGLARANYVGDEAYIRNMIMGRRLFHDLLGATDEQMEMLFNADTASGHSQMPQILKLGGQKYYSFQRPEGALDFKSIPKQFVWKGLDGSTVLVTRGHYGGFAYSDFPNWDYATRWDEIKQAFFDVDMKNKLELIASKSVLINHGSDDFIPLHNLWDVPIKLIEFINEWNIREKSRMRFGTPYDYFRVLEEEDVPEVQGIVDQCDLSFNAPQKGERSIWRKRQEMNSLLPRLETLAAMATLYGMEYPEAKINQLWMRHFEIMGHAIEFILNEDYTHLYSLALENFYTANNMLSLITEQLSMKISGGNQNEYVVINTQGFTRTETVKLHLTSWDGVGKFKLLDSNGNALETQIIEEYSGDKAGGNLNNSVDILAQVRLAPFSSCLLNVIYQDERQLFSGDMKYNITAGHHLRDNSVNLTIDNGLFTVTIGNSAIKSIVTRDGKTIKANNDNLNHLQFVKTTPTQDWLGSWQPVATFDFVPEKSTLIHNGPITWKYKTEGSIGEHRAVQTMTISRGDPNIIFDVRISSTGLEGYFITGFDCDTDTNIHGDIPYGVETRNLENEIASPEINELEWTNSIEQGYTGQFFARTWASFAKDNSPLALISGNCSIYYKFDKKQGRMSMILNRNFDLKAPEKSDGRPFMWFLQTPEETSGKGEHNYKYALMVREEREDFLDVIYASRRIQYPLEVQRRFTSGASEKQISSPVIDVDCENIITTALYKSGGEWIIRMYEGRGEATCFNLTPVFDCEKVEKVDLNEYYINDNRVELKAKTIMVFARPWEIITLKLYPWQGECRVEE
ncbi:MAG: glycoside hydrolase family 38 N-terminal domain-containing protein [Bacillota bacterium]